MELLGRSAEALQAAERAVALLPERTDVINGGWVAMLRAWVLIHSRIRSEEGYAELERLLGSFDLQPRWVAVSPHWLFLGRINYYGEYTVQEGNNSRQTFGSEWFPDVMVEYGFGDSGFALQVGANNLTDTTPDKNLIGQSRGGSIPGIVDSPGVFTYSRRAAPFGFNGGYWYLKAIYRF